ncbi:MAG: sulfatase-like hydrolase/transferase [Anaerolineaceae bacterium]|nr:sulfatase-like hydrolase/transferase [Anaerolineaceae bacterium]
MQHLPGILKKLGYQTMSIGVPQYVDMGMINFQNGFDSINGESNAISSLVSFLSAYGYNDAAYFSELFIGRVSDRLLHISFIENMENAYLLVTDPTPTSISVSMDEAFDLLTTNLTEANQSNQPLFAHIHMITTHGSMFYPRTQFFSSSLEQNEGWMTDFYDDAILDFDHWLEDLASYLKNHGLYEDTIIIVYTDHGEQWTIENRIPLIIHFPNDEYSGEVVANTQNLDIAPTLLEYIGVDVPDWMAGESLLGELDRTRLIYSAKINPDAFGREEKYEDVIAPPFYQFETIAVIQCQYIYEINLDEGTMVRKTIPDFVRPCDEEILATPDQIWDSAMALLTDYGFQIPSSWDDPMSYKIE